MIFIMGDEERGHLYRLSESMRLSAMLQISRIFRGISEPEYAE